MKPDWPVVFTLFRTELRMVLRDRRILATSILLPLLVTPLLLLASTWSVKKREQTLEKTAARYAVTGSRSDAVRALTDAARKLPPATETNKPAGPRFNFTEVSTDEPLAALHRGDLELVLEGLTAAEVQAETNTLGHTASDPASGKTNAPLAKAGSRGTDDLADDERIAAELPVVRVVFRGDRDMSMAALNRMLDALRDTRRQQQAALLLAERFPVKPASLGKVTEINLASGGHVAGLTLGRAVTLFVLMFVLMGGAVVATDSLAGEKERGTLETLLTTSARRIDILAAKRLVIVALGVMITVLQAGNLLVCVGFKLLPVPVNLAAAVTPWTVVLLLLLYLPLVALVANVLLLVSGLSRSYKEAQLYFFPVFILGLVPALAAMLPIPLRSAIAAVPIANLSVAVKEVLIGTFDWPMIVLSWVITAGAASWISRVGVRVLSSERMITASETDAVQFAGGAALFERHVLRWFAVLWALLLIVSNYTQTADLRVQLVINLVGLFFGASCLMIWRYRLSPASVLALRLPRPAAWAAVLLGVPGGLIVASGLFTLTSFLLPVPEKMLESFEESLLPKGVPATQLLFFMTVLPGVFEEIAFRGVLLHGLRRRLHPLVLALVVGAIFGIFHVALYRFVPTAALGVFLALLTMLTGSIYPAMLWHALSNGLGVVLHLSGMPITQLDAFGYVAGAGLLATAFYIAWRHQTPYPGLRPWRKQEFQAKV
jgi:sodium transport system permease protein